MAVEPILQDHAPRDSAVRLGPVRPQTGADLHLNQMRHMSRAASVGGGLPARVLSPQPPPAHQRRTPLRIRFRLAQLPMQPLQEHHTPRIPQRADHLGPVRAGQAWDRLRNPCFRRRSLVQLPVGMENLQGCGNLLPGRLDLLGVMKRADGSLPSAARMRGRFPRIPPLFGHCFSNACRAGRSRRRLHIRARRRSRGSAPGRAGRGRGSGRSTRSCRPRCGRGS